MTIALNGLASSASRTTDWFLDHEISSHRRDWRVLRPRLPPGGFCFGTFNTLGSDFDDSAATIIAMIKTSPAHLTFAASSEPFTGSSVCQTATEAWERSIGTITSTSSTNLPPPATWTVSAIPARRMSLLGLSSASGLRCSVTMGLTSIVPWPQSCKPHVSALSRISSHVESHPGHQAYLRHTL